MKSSDEIEATRSNLAWATTKTSGARGRGTASSEGPNGVSITVPIILPIDGEGKSLEKQIQLFLCGATYRQSGPGPQRLNDRMERTANRLGPLGRSGNIFQRAGARRQPHPWTSQDAGTAVVATPSAEATSSSSAGCRLSRREPCHPGAPERVRPRLLRESVLRGCVKAPPAEDTKRMRGPQLDTRWWRVLAARRHPQSIGQLCRSPGRSRSWRSLAFESPFSPWHTAWSEPLVSSAVLTVASTVGSARQSRVAATTTGA